MIGFLPPFESGESFEGYQTRVAGTYGGQANFAPRYDSAQAGLPSSIHETIRRLSNGTTVDAEHVVDRHTLYPLYAAFCEPERARLLRDFLLSGKRRPSDIVTGDHQRRFCPTCVREDEENLGYSYWRTIHLAPFVRVCPFHEMQLVQWNVPVTGPPQYLTRAQIPPLRTRDWISGTSIMCRVAQLADWILQRQPAPAPNGLKTIDKRLRRVLVDFGFSLAPSMLDRNVGGWYPTKYQELERLSRCLISCYGEQALVTLGVISWKLIMRRPVTYLVLMDYLGIDPNELFPTARGKATMQCAGAQAYEMA